MKSKLEANTQEPTLEAISKFVESLYHVDSPFEFAATLVRATARHYKADIAMLFRVAPSKSELVAEAGYDQAGELLEARATYALPWRANAERDMPKGGLTAWVAVSGEPLFVPNAEELLDRSRHPAHRGAWDSELHPEGPARTFGCLYAVPLRIGRSEGDASRPEDSVLGVLKIERRRDNPEGVFTHQQLVEFDLLAKQFTLVIALYERAMLRILSDARHAVAGRLADAVAGLELIADYLCPANRGKSGAIEHAAKLAARTRDDASRVSSWLRQALQTYMHPLERERRTLGEFGADAVAACARQQAVVKYEISTEDRKIPLNLMVSQSWDLHTVLLSLLNNAVVHSDRPDSAVLRVRIERPATSESAALTPGTIRFSVEDAGTPLPESVLQSAENEVRTGEVRSIVESKGTGLRRVYRVCAFRGWTVEYQQLHPGKGFNIRVTLPG